MLFMNNRCLTALKIIALMLLTSCGSRPPQPPPPPMPAPSSPSSPSSPSIPSPSSMPEPSAAPSEPINPSSRPGSSSENSDGKEVQEQIGKNLQERGAQVKQASKNLGDRNTDPLIPNGDSNPSIYNTMNDEEVTLTTEPTLASESQSTSGGSHEPLPDEIWDAQDTLEVAGVALQTAGLMVETAVNDDELAEAEIELSTARVAIIIAEENLADLKETLQNKNLNSGDAEAAISATEIALKEANLAIVLASEIFEVELPSSVATPEEPIFSDDNSGSDTDGRISELDKELEESLVTFDDTIDVVKRTLSDKTPAPLQASVSSSPNNSTEDIRGSEDSVVSEEPGESSDAGAGTSSKEAKAAGGSNILDAKTSEDIPDSQGDDIVAKQLREAAIAEKNPDIKEKLWEEYRRYKTSI